MNSAPIILEEHKSLFKDEDSFESFIQVFESALSQSDMPAVFWNQGLLFTAVSPQAMKEVISERILRRVSERPELLTEIKDRLERDDIVE